MRERPKPEASRGQLERAYASAALAADAADAADDAASEELRHVRLAELEPRKRAAIKELAAVLHHQARPLVDALRLIEDEEEQIAGSIDRMSSAWCSIGSGASGFEPALDVWTRHAQLNGYEIPKE